MFHVHRFTLIYKFTLKHCILSRSFYWELIVWFTIFTPSIYIYIYIYIYGRKKKKTTSSSLQACFVVAHSSPDEWATTKQACRDELVVYLFFSPIYSSLYFYVLSTVLRISSFTLYIYIYCSYIYIYIYNLHIYIYIYITNCRQFFLFFFFFFEKTVYLQ